MDAPGMISKAMTAASVPLTRADRFLGDCQWHAQGTRYSEESLQPALSGMHSVINIYDRELVIGPGEDGVYQATDP